MSQTAIKVENVSKLYRLGQVGTGTLKNDLNRFWHKVRGKEDPYLKIGQTNDRTKKAESEFAWALKDINFEIKQGEAIGIIGRNGAGKSTLLKILSKITSPTTGQIHINGRIASLLEVGTGFHPELSGKENIFMNGAILGMKKWEIQKKFDEIVDFAGVEAYVDTPVKRYSSGMIVRLGFAVAAHLEPEILIVDEVLAVGDAEFQKKCIGKMQDVSTNQGRTVLFVSHNMPSIKSLCTKAIILDNGHISQTGDVDEVVKKYLSINLEKSYGDIVYVSNKHRRARYSREIEFISVSLEDALYENCYATNLPIKLKAVLKSNLSLKKFRVSGSIYSEDSTRIGVFFSNHIEEPVKEGEEISIMIEVVSHNLAKGNYYFSLSVGNGDESTGNVEYDIIYEVIGFKITHKNDINTPIVKWNSDFGSISFQANCKKIDG
jgi:lipopolysaccharide transport system ATP-binding protein